MTPRTFILILTTAFCLVNVVTSYGQYTGIKKGQVKNRKNIINLHYDTSKTTIIPFEQSVGSLFGNTYKSGKLTQKELNQVDSLLIACVTNYNDSIREENKDWKIDLLNNNYRKQLVIMVNQLGQKEVLVNCFCEVHDSTWKKTFLFVDDGGSCFFKFKINLAKNIYYDLIVNGVA